MQRIRTTLIGTGVAAVLALGSCLAPGMTPAANALATTSDWRALSATSCPAVSGVRMGDYHTPQGATQGGGYIYVIFSNHAVADATLMTKWSWDGAKVSSAKCTIAVAFGPGKSANLRHGNGVTYHPNYNGTGPKLLVTDGTNGVSGAGSNSPWVMVVNAINLSAVTAFTFKNAAGNDVRAASICYSSAAHKYVVRNGKTLYVWGESNNKPKATPEKTFTDTHSTWNATQGLDCSTDNIYTVVTSGDNTHINQYRWTGAYVRQLNLSGVGEGEGLFHYNGKFYLTINNQPASRGSTPDVIRGLASW